MLTVKRGAGLSPCSNDSLLLAVTLVEFLNTSASLCVTLTPREKRMALGADIDAKLLLGGSRRELIAAAASHRSLEELRMDTFFRLLHLTFPKPGH